MQAAPDTGLSVEELDGLVRREGYCHTADIPQPRRTRLFFSDNPYEQDQARAMCRRCDVQEECLALAWKRKEKWGIWGGLDERERRGEARRRRNRRRR